MLITERVEYYYDNLVHWIVKTLFLILLHKVPHLRFTIEDT